MFKKTILISSAIFSLGFPVGAWAVNPADVFLNQKMDKSEAKLRQAEKTEWDRTPECPFGTNKNDQEQQ